MSLRKTLIRFIERKRDKQRGKLEKQAKTQNFKIYHKSFLQQIATGVAGLGMLASANALSASTITAHVNATTINQTGNTYNVHTSKISGQNAFNSFQQFNLDANNTANLHLPPNTTNLLNFVNTQINVNGTVNAIKNSKIGGNLFYLCSQGLVIGSGGIINCGSFFALTPTEDFMKKFVKSNTLLIDGNSNEIGYITSQQIENRNQIIGGKGVPINSEGSITISGQINAIDNVGLYAGGVVDNSANATGIKVNSGASIKTGVTDFSALVNTSATPGVTTTGLAMTSDDDGNISIVSVADNTHQTSSISKLATGLSSFSKAKAQAVVSVDGSVESARDANFEAIAVNGTLSAINKTYHEFGEQKDLESYASTSKLADVSAKVEFKSNAEVTAGRDLKANAIAKSFYKKSANVTELGLGILGLSSPVNIDADLAVVEVDSTVDVNSGARLTAKNKLDIKARAETDVILGAGTSIAKIKQSSGLSSGAVYAKIDSKATVNIDGTLIAKDTADSSKGSITIAADSGNSLDAKASTKTANDPAKLAMGAVIADVDYRAKVNVNPGSTIAAEQNVNVSTVTTTSLSTVASAQTGDKSYAAVAVNVTDSTFPAKITE